MPGQTISTASANLYLTSTSNPLTITSTGSVTSTGSSDAINAPSGTAWQINNAGTISGVVGTSAAGIYSPASGITIQNTGKISGHVAGLYLTAGGTIVNGATGQISATGSYGVYVSGAAATVTNQGTISGASYAVDLTFSSASNRVVVAPGAVFSGSVNGNGGVLELTAGTGSIGPIGSSSFSNFQTLIDDAGGNWTLTGSNTIANVTDNGSLVTAGSLHVSTAVSSTSTGQFDLQAGGLLEVAADTATHSLIDFLGAGQLTIDNAALFGTGVGGSSYAGPLIENFVTGDTIDLHSFSATGAALLYNPANGLLQITNGSSQVATLDFQNSTLGTGSFSFASDGGGGIKITHS